MICDDMEVSVSKWDVLTMSSLTQYTYHLNCVSSGNVRMFCGAKLSNVLLKSHDIYNGTLGNVCYDFVILGYEL